MVALAPNDTVALGLQRSVGFAGDLLDLRARRREERRGFVEHWPPLRVVYGNRGHVYVAADSILEQFDGVSNVPRHVARVVDHDVPATRALQCLEAWRDIRVAVADQYLDAVAKRPLRALSAIEQSDAMPARERGPRNPVPPRKRMSSGFAARPGSTEAPAASVAARAVAGNAIIAIVHFSSSRREVMLSTPCATH
jgi:hypothetical protein